MNTKTAESLICFILGLIFIVPIALWSGFATMKLWLWFVVPLGFPVLTLVHAIGLHLVISYLTHKNIHDDRSSIEKATETIVNGIINPGWCLLCGWIIHRFM